MSREDPQLKIRLPSDLKAKIEKAAQDNRRSVNAEVVACLEKAFAPDARVETIVDSYPLTTQISRDKLIANAAEQAYTMDQIKVIMEKVAQSIYQVSHDRDKRKRAAAKKAEGDQ